MTRRLPAALAGAVLVLATVAGCGSGSYAPTPVAATPRSPGPTPIPGTATPAPAATGAAVTAANCLQSYAPQGALPGPGSLPAGSTMETIRKKGGLVAGVSADSLLLGARNPVTGRIEGFDIDVLRAVAQAIFGDPDKVELRVITTADRIPLLEDNKVDIVARNMTITCDRWTKIAFSTEYYRSGQKVLVPLGSKATGSGRAQGAEGLRARQARPAWTSSGSTAASSPSRRTPTPPASCSSSRATCKPSPATTPCWPAWPRRTPTPRWSAARSPPSPTDWASTARTSTWSGSSTACSSRCAGTAGSTAAYDRWLKPALGPAPAPPTPVYGRP